MEPLFITGPPGVGKTTLVKNLCQALKKSRSDLKIAGFFTQEIRQNGSRVGFEVVSLSSGCRASLATVVHPPAAAPGGPMVGKYHVTVDQFERVALPELSSATGCQLLVLDELGKMESLSRPFVAALTERLSRPQCVVVATVPEKPLPLVRTATDALRPRLLAVTRANRDRLLEDAVRHVLAQF